MSEKAQDPEEMCLSLEHQTRRKPLKKWVILIADRVTVSLNILYTPNQETEGSKDRFTRHFVPRSPFERRAVRQRDYACFALHK